MKTAPTSLKVHQIITQFQEKVLIPRPEFQRRLVWTRRDKIAFIETILSGFPFPEIYLADGDVDLETGKGNQLLVDGQQRVTAIVEYFRGEIKYLGPGSAIQPYAKLAKDAQSDFMQYDVAVRNLGPVANEILVDVFRRINLTNYSLTNMEINNAIYSGEFKKFCERLSERSIFDEKRFFRPNQIKRMGDVSYIASVVASMIGDYFNRDDDLEEYLRAYNDDFPMEAEIERRFDAVLNFIVNMNVDENTRLWKQSDFLTLFVELDRLLHKQGVPLEAGSAAEALKEFYAEVDRPEAERPEWAAAYHKAALQAANDRANRALRGHLVRVALTDASKSDP